jgi:hypothetical protein
MIPSRHIPSKQLAKDAVPVATPAPNILAVNMPVIGLGRGLHYGGPKLISSHGFKAATIGGGRKTLRPA